MEGLVVEGIRKKYGDKDVVKDVYFSVRKGEIFGLLGPNGAGKSTLIRMVAGLLPPDGGKIEIGGRWLWGEKHDIAKNSIGYGAQRFSLYSTLTVEENLVFFAQLRGFNRIAAEYRKDELLQELDLHDKRHERAENLSGGWKQRLTLAVSVVSNPRLLILDEPTAGMDSLSRRYVWDYIHKLTRSGVTCLVTTHYMDEAERCGLIGFMLEGQVVAIDTPRNLKSSAIVTPPNRKRLQVFAEPGALYSDLLLDLPGVYDAIPFGEGWHILVHSEVDNGELYRLLIKRGVVSPDIANIEATLEDSFVAYAKMGENK